MARQLLRNSKVVIEYQGRAYELTALSSFSASTSLGEVTKKRKTLFSNTVRQHSFTSRVNATTTTLSIYLTKNNLEKLFFDLVGLDSSGGTKSPLPKSVEMSTRLFSMYIINEDSVVYSEHNFVEAIDISFDKSTPLALSVSISSANLTAVPYVQASKASTTQGAIRTPTPTHLSIGNRTLETITTASISIQQTASWVDNKDLFRTTDVFELTKAATTDLIVSATIQTNFDTQSSRYNIANSQDIELAKSGFGFVASNARLVHNLDVQSIYKNRLDLSITEDTGEVYFYFGE